MAKHEAARLATVGRRNALTVRQQRKKIRRAYWASLIIVIVGFLPITILATQSALNGRTLSEEADDVVKTQSTWPSTTQADTQAKADAYNKKLYESKQPVIGGVARNTDVGNTVDFTGGDDEEYVSDLNEPSGVMGTVEIPSISVNLPIRHGSGDEALANGAGHLYGTSLPVGGKNTRSVITAHRGVPGKLLFSRLNELKPGDFFYLHVNGRTLAYKVTEQETVGPDDIDAVRIVDGKDLVTLLTCTPYGVNTERLIVTGERAEMPDPAPEPQNAKKDKFPLLFGAGALAIVVITILLFKPVKPKDKQPGGVVVDGDDAREDAETADETALDGFNDAENTADDIADVMQAADRTKTFKKDRLNEVEVVQTGHGDCCRCWHAGDAGSCYQR